MGETERTVPDAHTRDEDERDGRATHGADRPPTADEEVEADAEAASHADEREAVAEHERDMDRRGANVKGEGRIS
jgi:hypothetical protein